MSVFPPNAADGTIIEIKDELFFQYNKKENTWVKVDGFAVSFDLATVLKNGLMSSDDLLKLNTLLLPPPRTALTSERCTFTFDSGTFGFRSSKDHLFIEHELNLRDKDEQGFDVDRKQVWRIHENTYGINFRVNVEQLIKELESRNHLTYRRSMGPIGPKGDRGKDGINNLETGPKGLPGEDGANLPYDGILAQEQAGFLAGEGNRGVIDVRMDEGEDGNFILVTRSIIGNPELCPRFVLPENIDSKWIVAIDERPPQRILLDECDPTICGTNLDCSPVVARSIIQTFCSMRLYFVDFSLIEETIRTRFEELVTELKETKEQVTLELMKAMIDLFTEQKLALCCAIENCESRRENQRHRNIIDSARIQAAQGGFSIKVDGEATKNYVDTDPEKDCPPSQEELDAIDNEAIPATTGSSGSVASSGGTEVAVVPRYITFECPNTISTGVTPENPRAFQNPGTVFELPAGKYTATILQLAPPANSPNSVISGALGTFTGVGQAGYEQLRANPAQIGPGFDQVFAKATPYNLNYKFYWQGIEGEEAFTHPDVGDFKDLTKCFNAGQQIATQFQFTHVGGNVRFEYTGGGAERSKFENFMITVAGRKIPFRGGATDGGAVSFELVKEVEEDAVTTPERQSCEAFEADAVIATKTNSLRLTRQKLHATPESFIPTSISGSPQAAVATLELNTPGTYEVTVNNAGVYRAQIVDVVSNLPGIPAPNGRWLFAQKKAPDQVADHYIFIPVTDTFLTTATSRLVNGTPKNPLFFGGYLVTEAMYKAALANDLDQFMDAVRASAELVVSDPYYTGLNNPNWDIIRSFNAENLLDKVRNLRPYNSGHIAVAYTGFATEHSVTSERLTRILENVDGFTNIDDDRAYFNGKSFQVEVDEPTQLELYYDTNDMFDQNGQILNTGVQFQFPQVSPNSGDVTLSVKCVQSEFTRCAEPLVKARLDCNFRNKEPNALLVELPSGDYVLTVSDCCCVGAQGYFGRLAVKYNGVDGETLLTNPDLGNFVDETEAALNYQGNSLSFSHTGGDVKIWVPGGVANTGTAQVMEVQIQTRDCLDQEVLGTAQTAITEGDDEVFGVFDGCDMTTDQVNFYEAGWKARSGCAAHVKIGNVQWIVIKRSIGNDTTCGGGESADSDCISKGLANGFHPAIAFPTLDGQCFIGKPTGGYQHFVRDVDLESIILAQIVAGDVIEQVNNPAENISAIIFPQDI